MSFGADVSKCVTGREVSAAPKAGCGASTAADVRS